MPSLISLATMEILIRQYGYFLFFPLTVAEGPIVTIIAAFLASLGYLNVFIVYILAVVGDLVGDSLYYLVGQLGKKRFLKKGSFLGIPGDKIAKVEAHFESHSGKTILFGKLTHGAGFAVLVAAGVAGAPFWEFIWYNFLGTVPKALLFVILGYYFGQAYAAINTYLDYAGLIMFALIVIGLAIYFWFFRKPKDNINND